MKVLHNQRITISLPPEINLLAEEIKTQTQLSKSEIIAKGIELFAKEMRRRQMIENAARLASLYKNDEELTEVTKSLSHEDFV